MDIKTGPGAYIVLYAPAGKLPALQQVAPLPGWLASALPRSAEKTNDGAQYSWAEMAKRCHHYKSNERTRKYLREDSERLARGACGEQRRLLNAVGFKWGQRVAAGFVCPHEALLRLMQAAGRMVNYDAGRPWDAAEVQDCIRAAMLRGYRGG